MSPWRGPSVPGEIPTLGPEVAAFIESYVVIPDGMYAGQPLILGKEQREFINGFYCLKLNADVDLRKPSRAFVYDRGGQLVAPQKSGKSPLAAALVIAEAFGPVLFDGWNSDGEPQGRPWATPWIQITAVSEEQTGNVFRSLLPMIQLGSLQADIPDTGETRINLPGGGRIDPVTASARSRLGQRITFCIEDEAHDWTKRNGGRKLADTQRRNLAGMGGRFLEIGNAWDPAEESVAQSTFEKESGVFKLMLQPGPGSIRNQSDRMRILRRLYGESWWVDIERISSEIDNLLDRGEMAQAERFFFNRVVPGEDRAFDPKQWDSLARPGTSIPDRNRIAIGIDGARYEDALAIVATDIKSGFQWPLGIWEKPPNAGPDYEHPMDEVDGVLNDAMARFDVWRVYVDPGSQYANITPLMERWQGRFGEKRIINWAMNRPKPTCYLYRNYASAIMVGDLTHDGNELMARHIKQARRKLMNVWDEDNHQMWTCQKEAPNSPAKIDAAAAGALSWQCRGDAIASGSADPGTYDRPEDKCGNCGHLSRLHVPACRVRSDDCKAWVEPDLGGEDGLTISIHGGGQLRGGVDAASPG